LGINYHRPLIHWNSNMWIHVRLWKFTNGSSQFPFVSWDSIHYIYILRRMNKVDWMALLIFHSCKVLKPLLINLSTKHYIIFW
jgi:hypothetical protein